MKKMISASIALFVMEEPQVGPTVVTLILSAGVVAPDAPPWSTSSWSWTPVAAPRLGRRRGRRRAVVDVVAASAVVLGGVRRGHLEQRLLHVVARPRPAGSATGLLRSDCTLSVCLFPVPSSSHRRVDQPGALQGVGRLGLGDARRGDRPLGPALELDPEVQPAAQDDRDDPEHDDRPSRC